MDIDVLKKCGKTVTFQNGQTICREGEDGHSMYVLLKGSVEVVINSFSDQVQSLGCMQEGSFFGEMSLLEGKPRTATIVADSDETVVLEISEVDMPELLQNAPTVAYRLLLTLNNRLNAMLDRIEQKDRKYVFRYKKDQIYTVIQKMDMRSFDEVSSRDAAYVWTLLKYLSTSLEKLNREYISLMKE